MIKLFHGGETSGIDSIRVFGLNPNREFYMTRSIDLATSAVGISGTVLEVELPRNVFEDASRQGHFVERPYVGTIPCDHEKEVKINPGEGIDIINGYIERYRMY